MSEDVLISIKLEGAENEAKINANTQAITALNKSNQDLIAANKELAKQGQENSKAYLDNAKQIEINKQKITENTASRKGLVQAIITEDNSIKGLQVRNAELIRQRNTINVGTDEGRKRIAAINAQLDANNAKIKENSSALEKQKINIGNYASALDGIVPGLSGFVSGIQSSTKAALAFIATPIGAVLAGVVAALATLKAAIMTNDATADEFGKRWAQVTAVFDVALRRIGLLGDALISLVKGDFTDAANKASAAFTGFNDELSKAITLTGELQDRQNELDDDLNKFNATEQARKNIIDKLIIQSKDLSKSEAERLALSTKAEALLNKLTEDRIDLSLRQSDIDIKAIGLKHDAQIGLNETTKEYGLRLLENSAIGGDEAKKISDAIRSIDEAEGESIKTLEKLQSQQNKLFEEKQVKFTEDSEFVKELRQKDADDNLTIQDEYQQQSIQLTTSFEDAIFKTKKAFREKELDFQQQSAQLYIEREKQKQIAVLKIAGSISSGLASIFKQGSDAAKAAALVDIAVNTALGYIQGLDIAQKSAKATGPAAAFAFPIFYASQIAAVLGAAGKAKGVLSQAAGGGEFLTKGPTLLMVGDNPGGVERVSVTPISGKGQTIVGDGLVKMAGGGTLTAMGDIRAASQMQVQTVLVLEDFEYKQLSKYQTLQQATVV